MDDKVLVLDENGNEIEANLINILEISGNEYLLYSIPSDSENDLVYANKIIRHDDDFDLAVIDDMEEKKVVNDAILGIFRKDLE